MLYLQKCFYFWKEAKNNMSWNPFRNALDFSTPFTPGLPGWPLRPETLAPGRPICPFGPGIPGDPGNPFLPKPCRPGSPLSPLGPGKPGRAPT